MSRIKNPVNQKRHTNIAIVRLKKAGIKFELAAYPAKVAEWKAKVETDLDEVLQVVTVFTNVGKGVAASSDELQKAFGSDDQKECCKRILDGGELQVSEQERKVQLDQTFKDIATIVAEKCINTETGKPFPQGIIERAMRDAHFSVHPTKNAKQQALGVIKLLKEKSNLKIDRAKMRVVITISPSGRQALATANQLGEIESEKTLAGSDDRLQLQCLIDPSSFRDVNDLVKKESGVVEVLAHNSATETTDD